MTTDQRDILAVIQRHIEEAGRPLTYAEFGRIALYHEKLGYYRRDKRRIGRHAESDFYTATSLGHVFRELVVEACRGFVAPGSTEEFSFIEIGAEPDGGLLNDEDNAPFATTRSLHIGDPIKLNGQAIVFSNELFDAQPFHRVIATENKWQELGVDCTATGLHEVTLPELSAPVLEIALPKPPMPGYRIDLPITSVRLLEQLVSSHWQGLFLAFDYGKSWEELIGATPQGTARAYYRHQQSNDLLARPGEQDLTCHVCWDWLTAGLAAAEFEQISVESQESFFVHRSRPAVERIVMKKAGQFDADRQSLQQLLHPGNMGQKFQVLSAVRNG